MLEALSTPYSFILINFITISLLWFPYCPLPRGGGTSGSPFPCPRQISLIYTGKEGWKGCECTLCTVFLHKHRKYSLITEGNKSPFLSRFIPTLQERRKRIGIPSYTFCTIWITKGNRVGTGEGDPVKILMQPNPRNMAKSCRNNCCNRNCSNLTHSCPPPRTFPISALRAALRAPHSLILLIAHYCTCGVLIQCTI